MTPIRCILFDLDGTLLDTSYDFAYALNRTCQAFDAPLIRYQDIRKTVSQGGLAMTQLAFPELTGEALEVRRQYFLNIYFENIAKHTQLFPGLKDALTHLKEQNLAWGIVTNKPGWLTDKLLNHIALPSEPQSVISGDTLSVKKPDPAPLHLAAEQCGVAAEQCIYIGDHPRDIEAGINAGMITGAAMFGYLPETAGKQSWPADHFFDTPCDITEFIKTLPKRTSN